MLWSEDSYQGIRTTFNTKEQWEKRLRWKRVSTLGYERIGFAVIKFPKAILAANVMTWAHRF